MKSRTRNASAEELTGTALGMMRSFTMAHQRNETIFRGEIIPSSSRQLEDLKAAVRSRGGSFYIDEVDGKHFLVVSLPVKSKAPKKRVPNLILFLATVVSTLVVGAVLEGADLGSEPGSILTGIPFSMTIMGILGLHELGHYFAARRYGLDVSLPYFIPFPTLLGTLGAFIKLRSSIHNRRMLLEIGAAGPIAGFLVAVPAVIYGLSLSTFHEVPTEGIGGISLGSSLLFAALERLVAGTAPEGYELYPHPVAFAGWAGLFVTALNLLPIGQLDGGHVCYALFGSTQKKISSAFFLLLIPLGFYWPGWFVWVLLILVLIKIPHPPVIHEDVPLGKWRRVLGWVVILVFLLTFIPVPVDIS